ncbi:MAG: DNA primase [Prevotellaceae bacterium]|nr:DNA primase [Prevotellaceae bacterium]
MIDRATIEKVNDAARIEEVVGDFVTLKRAGVNLKGLCPFHDDRTPSFFVSPARNYCKCFACGEGGNPVNFIMKHEQLNYADAIRYLARKYGIPIEEKELTAEDMRRKDDRESMFILNEWARDWFRKQLTETEEGRDIGLTYLHGRGFRDDTIERFQVGYCPNSRETSLHADALKAGFREEYITNTPNEQDTRQSVGTGLAWKNDRGQLRDRFSGRVIWPILTISGKVAGFGGRVLDAATKGVNVKYQNSPESMIYSKRRELFGLMQAKQAISKQDLCYLVEGYTDVMAMHQSGVENVVASSGTALTEEQIGMIHRLTDNIVVVYDGDAAGIKASQRGIDMLLRQGMNVRLLLLPDDDDPDSFARKHNATEFKEYITSHQTDFIKFKTSLLMEEAKDDPVGLSRLTNNIVQSIAVIPDEITRSLYVKETAQTMGMQEGLIASALNKQLKKNKEEWQRQRERDEKRAAADTQQAETKQKEEPTADTTTTERKEKEDRFYQIEKELTRAVVRYGNTVIGEMVTDEGKTKSVSVAEYIHLALRQDGLELRDPLLRSMLAEALEHAGEENFDTEKFFLNHLDQEVSSLAFELVTDKEQLSKLFSGDEAETEEEKNSARAMELVPHLMTDYKLGIVKEQLKAVTDEIKKPETMSDMNRYNEIMKRFMRLKETERKLSMAGGDRVIS